MKRVIVVGGGKIGATIADLLDGSSDYEVMILDRRDRTLVDLQISPTVGFRQIDVSSPVALAAAIDGADAVVNAAPFHLTTHVATAAALAKAHYLDLTEDVASTRAVKELADKASTAFAPQCGLAPGFISILGHDLTKRFDTLVDVRLAVGALPQFPSNALSYNLTWSTEGLINEYCEPCEAIVNGSLRQVQPLEDLEQFALDGVAYEAFNTSGGLGSLSDTLRGRVRNLSYRTIRYPGHAAVMKALLNDLGLRDRRDVLKDILEQAIPATLQDVVIVYANVSGMRAGRLVQETSAHKIYASRVQGRLRSAIQITTAAGLCAVLDLLMDGALPQQGLIRQEEVRLEDFLENRFGRLYAPDAVRSAAA
jgi:saccharopine dehydrogenase-like NADP-dependent oxidoreductase